MTEERDDRHAEWLRRVLEEGLDPGSAEARQMTGNLDGFEDEVDGARRVVALLERSGSAQREELAALEGVDAERSRELVREFLERREAGGAGRGGLRLVPRWLGPLAAAAALLLAWLGWSLRTPEEAPREIRMGASIALEAPLEGGADLAEFRWSYELASGGWFTLVVRDPSKPALESELARKANLTEPRWRPTPAEVAGWPQEIAWEVLAHDGTGRVEASAQHTLRRQL